MVPVGARVCLCVYGYVCVCAHVCVCRRATQCRCVCVNAGRRAHTCICMQAHVCMGLVCLHECKSLYVHTRVHVLAEVPVCAKFAYVSRSIVGHIPRGLYSELSSLPLRLAYLSLGQLQMLRQHSSFTAENQTNK